MRRTSGIAWAVWAFLATWSCTANGESDDYIQGALVAPTIPQVGPHRSLLEVSCEPASPKLEGW